jgi:hypothetical protein
MSVSATRLSPEGFRSVRTRLSFATREAPVGLAKIVRTRISWPALLLGGIVASVAMLGMLAFAGRPTRPAAAPAPILPVAAAPAAPAWIEVNRPFQTYDLAGGRFARLPLAYAARRDAAGTGRRDILTYGIALPGEAFLRLVVSRQGAEPAPDTTVFLDVARLAAGAGLAVTRSGLAATLDTRFGVVETIGLSVARRDRSAPCLGFRLADPASAAVLGLAGMACGTDERPIDPTSLACTIEKIDLVSAGDDEELRAVFVAAERRRGAACHDEHAARLTPGFPDGERPMRFALKGPL